MNGNNMTEQLSLVVLGHVDHGKSTVLGRLLAETGALPEGKLQQIRDLCARTAKPFEYAFLLDALKDERDQGITIDAARCFFKTARRRYLVFDAPGHVEFLRNMITGAAKAEAAFLVIDAHEGVKENSKRHGYIASMLGLRQISVLVNKMDLCDFDSGAFESIRDEYAAFLDRLGIHPVSFIPISAMGGDNMVERSARTGWYDGPSVLAQLDAFRKETPGSDGPLRFPLQDIYKFTASGDERRILAGTIQTGSLGVGDSVVFLPSGKQARVTSIEAFNAPERQRAVAGEATGITLDAELYLKPGELITRAADPRPEVGTRFRANLFWMGKAPLIRGKRYKLKIGAARLPLKLVEVIHVLDASDLTTESNKQQVDRHDVAECVLESLRPFAFDRIDAVQATGRFVIVDNCEIAAAGVVLENMKDRGSTVGDHVRAREFSWQPGAISSGERSATYGHGAKFVVFTGDDAGRVEALAAALERRLFRNGFKAYSLRVANVVRGLDADLASESDIRDEHIRRLGELARIMTESGQIFITSLPGADENDVRVLEMLNHPHEILIVHAGAEALPGVRATLHLAAQTAIDDCIERTFELLKAKNVILEYCI